MGGKDSKKQNVLKVTLPQEGGVFVIPVAPSNSLVKRPKIFSSPILPQAALPYGVLNRGWDSTLTTFGLRAREWKFLIEAYPGEAWIINTYLDRGISLMIGCPTCPGSTFLLTPVKSLYLKRTLICWTLTTKGRGRVFPPFLLDKGYALSLRRGG